MDWEFLKRFSANSNTKEHLQIHAASMPHRCRCNIAIFNCINRDARGIKADREGRGMGRVASIDIFC
jgi:hypothetical protein